ncbi:hypothetical protein [Planctomicrobium sp. SH664]|uniref:hypothetical protein n=1 Tax=Planctomicrobium sp. SH664 TaxID=3448125 RepID=UPI003F5B531D
MDLQKVSVTCFLACYVLALLLEATQFLRRSHVLRWGTVILSLAGLVAQTIYLVVRSGQHSLPPLLGSTHDWLLVSAWLIVVMFCGIQLWNRDLAIGIFALPLVVVLVVTSQFVNTAPNPRVGELRWWSMLHASFWVFGILGVSLALLVSLMYLVQHYRLKHKRLELPALHLFSLERLSRLNWWLVIFSVPMLTLGMASGLWMTHLSKGGDHPVNLVNIAFAANATIWVAMAVLFGWLLAARRPVGRTVAWRTIWACAFLLVTLLVIKVLSADGIHGGGAA